MITFKQLKTGPVGRAAGLSVESCDFAHYCNDAVRQLLIRGSWWSTVQPMTGCVRDRVITWPRGVSTVLGMDICDKAAILSNRWYQFMQPDSWFRYQAGQFSKNGWCGRTTVESRSTACVFNPIKSDGFVIRTFITKTSDVGKSITYYGTDVNGQPIITTRNDGIIREGVQVFLAKPYADTPMDIRHVERVVKDETDGDVIAYQYAVAGGFMLDLGRYQPTEVNPEYITTVAHGGHSNCGCNYTVKALVSMAFVPFKFDDDMVQIDCEDAIRDMVLSIRKKEQGDISASLAYETSAIRELNFQMKKRFQDEQFIVNFRLFGNDSLENRNIRIGQI